MTFSERMGLAPEKVFQTDRIDPDLRVYIFNVIYEMLFRNGKDAMPVSEHNYIDSRLNYLWAYRFNQYSDTRPSRKSAFATHFREYISKREWNLVYDLVEAVIYTDDRNKDSYTAGFNFYLEKENSAYRIIDGKVAPIISSMEIASICEALRASDKYAGAKEHLRRSLELLSDKTDPDYRNSIKESISAVESVAKVLVGDGDRLGTVLAKLQRDRGLHGSLKEGFSKIYGWTSDANGTRHAMMEVEHPSQADARFMLIACSAFVNYLIATIVAK